MLSAYANPHGKMNLYDLASTPDYLAIPQFQGYCWPYIMCNTIIKCVIKIK